MVGINHNMIISGLLETKNHTLEQRDAINRHQCLGHCVSQRLEPCAQTRGEYQSVGFHLKTPVPYFVPYGIRES